MFGFFSKPPLQVFIAVYTNEVKDYCDRSFFKSLSRISYGNPVHIVDNSDQDSYIGHLRNRYQTKSNFNFYHLAVRRDPEFSLFHRRVTESVLLLRKKFLQTDLRYFMILESDVIPPRNLLRLFQKDIELLDRTDPSWGILGALYHLNFHKYQLQGLQKTHHVLSGCTVYKRALIEKFPFRWSQENMAAFSDAWISLDAKPEYHLYNDHAIQCAHLENTKTGTRHSRSL